MKDLPIPAAPADFDDPGFLAEVPASPEVIDALFRAYLGRGAKENAQSALKERRASVAQVERELRGSREYRSKARLLRDQDRTQYDGAMLYLPMARIVFCPIAKVANTSVKDWALRLCGEGRANPGMSHYWLDSGQNKMQGRHWAFALRDRIARDPGWASVALLRDPFDRLVSCYCDKFGRNRAQDSVLHHTRAGSVSGSSASTSTRPRARCRIRTGPRNGAICRTGTGTGSSRSSGSRHSRLSCARACPRICARSGWA